MILVFYGRHKNEYSTQIAKELCKERKEPKVKFLLIQGYDKDIVRYINALKKGKLRWNDYLINELELEKRIMKRQIIPHIHKLNPFLAIDMHSTDIRAPPDIIISTAKEGQTLYWKEIKNIFEVEKKEKVVDRLFLFRPKEKDFFKEHGWSFEVFCYSEKTLELVKEVKVDLPIFVYERNIPYREIRDKFLYIELVIDRDRKNVEKEIKKGVSKFLERLVKKDSQEMIVA